MALSCKFVGLQCLGLSPSHSKKADNPDCYVSGDGLKTAALNQPARFFLHTSSPDLLYLDLDICRIVTNRSLETTPANTPVEFECLEENFHSVTYHPQKPGEYQISVRWKGNHVMGSPFSVKVMDVPTIVVPQLKCNDENEEVWKLREGVKQNSESNTK